MILQQTPKFKQAYKRLFENQRPAVNGAIKEIQENPQVGENKTGDLNGVLVHKFRVLDSLYLLGYQYDEGVITLLALGVHENFYRDLKNYRK